MSPDAVVEVRRRLGPLAEVDVALGPLTTYRVGGSADVLVRVSDERALRQVAEAVADTGVDVLVVGKGSNLLVADRGFRGVALVLDDAFADVAVDGTTVRAGAAAALPVVARRTVAAGLAGFEWAVGVPGSVGGGVRMNAGGHGSDLAASLLRVRLLDLRTGEDGFVPASALALGYRRSSVASHQVVLSAELELVEGDPEAGAALLADIVRWRREHQPGGPNAGSVFANPPGDSAGRLVESVGAKGLRIGTAAVSTKHANFIQADDGGRADDVYALMGEVHDRVLGATGVALHPETRCIGFPLNPRLEVESLSQVEGRVPGVPIDPRIRARRIEVQRVAGRRRLRRLVDVGLVLLVVLAFVGALRSPLLDVESVRVAGARRTPTAAVLEAAGVTPGDQLVDVSLGAVGERVAALPWVGEVRLHRRLGGRVEIAVTERAAAAVLGDGDRAVLVDPTGRVLARVADEPELGAKLVRVGGFSGDLTPGAFVDAEAQGALESASRLAEGVPGAIAEVAVGPELAATLVEGGDVRFGDTTRLAAKLRSLVTVLAQVDLTCLERLDLRSPGTPVLTRRGGVLVASQPNCEVEACSTSTRRSARASERCPARRPRRPTPPLVKEGT